MKHLIATMAVLAVAAPAVAQPTIAIVRARAWTMQSPQPLENATIIISNGKIASVRAGGPVPADATVIDAAGKPVTPGFVNAATQIGLTEISSAQDTRDTAVISDEVGPSFDVSFALNGNSTLVDLARADGLTQALAYPSASQVPPFSGEAALLRLRNGADILDRAKAAMFVVIGGSTWEKNVGSRAAQWQLLRAAFDEARTPRPPIDSKEPRLSRSDLSAIRALLSRGFPLAIVTHRESDIRQAIKLAADYRIRVVIVGGAEAWRAADALAAANIPVVLDPQANLPATFDQLGARQESAAILAKAGVRIAFGMVGGALGANYNAGLALREGAGLAVANGLPYFEALQAVTRTPLMIFGGSGSGTIAAGAAADLVVWSGDPLEPSSTAEAVIVEGKRVSTGNRQRALVDRYLKDPATRAGKPPAQ